MMCLKLVLVIKQFMCGSLIELCSREIIRMTNISMFVDCLDGETQMPKKVSHKVLRCFPIIPGLHGFFFSNEISTHKIWHKLKRAVEKKKF
jgi:hypothetical protein